MADIVVIGAGIAGSALAAALASEGCEVLVLERQTEYKDRVRGESMSPWGVPEMRRLDLEDVLVEAGGGYATTIHGYDEVVSQEEAETTAAPLSLFVEGVPGFFDVGHPQACEALAQHAARCGATVVRGIGDVGVTLGDSPAVRYELDGQTHHVTCRLIVGADGRQSVVRRALGIELQQVESKAMLGGLLVEGVDGGEIVVLGTNGDVHYIVFPRPNGFTRLYTARSHEDRAATSGADRAEHFLDPFRAGIFPGSERFGDAKPAGPCAYYRGSDSWTDAPLAQRGAVLIGDAAGWSDPVIGQGLSVAMRDARTVRDVLVASDDWSTAAFEEYRTERAERMRRIRVLAGVDTELRCTFTEQGRVRRRAFYDRYLTDPELFNFVLALLAGPETAPPETFADTFIDKVLTLA